MIVLDTSALLWPFEGGPDLEEEARRLLGVRQLCVPSAVIDELRAHAGDGKRGQAAGAALALAQRFRIAATDLPGDDGVLDVARREEAAVMTMDRVLADQVAAAGLVVLTPRAGRFERRR